jgi:hypothetical protein
MRFANDARNAILKEGSLATSNYTYVEHLDGDNLAEFSRQHSPPGTVSTFIGDQLGGNGWEVQMPDGSIQKVYLDLPDQPGLSVTSWLGFVDPPTHHDGSPITDTSLANIGALYVGTLVHLVEEFAMRFGVDEA